MRPGDDRNETDGRRSARSPRGFPGHVPLIRNITILTGDYRGRSGPRTPSYPNVTDRQRLLQAVRARISPASPPTHSLMPTTSPPRRQTRPLPLSRRRRTLRSQTPPRHPIDIRHHRIHAPTRSIRLGHARTKLGRARWRRLGSRGLLGHLVEA